eukprot:1131012-Pelagomonas_calceolata.AAC.2
MPMPSNDSCRLPHIKKQGRCAVHKREEPEDDEGFEFTECFAALQWVRKENSKLSGASVAVLLRAQG